MMRQNATVAKKKKKQEMARIIRLVERAEANDPRLKRIRAKQAEERKRRKVRSGSVVHGTRPPLTGPHAPSLTHLQAAEKEQRRKEREARLAEAAAQSQSSAIDSTAEAMRKSKEEAVRLFDAFAEEYRQTVRARGGVCGGGSVTRNPPSRWSGARSRTSSPSPTTSCAPSGTR